MIEFSLQVESRIITAVLPELEKLFALSAKDEDFSEILPNIDDPDFKEAWIDGLKHEAKVDRNALARLLKSPRFKFGRVEVKENDVDDLLRGLTEIRFTIRKTSLKEVVDEELEAGMSSISSTHPEVQIGYFAYLLMAEVQERLIQEIS
jgi:hypothetical protein